MDDWVAQVAHFYNITLSKKQRYKDSINDGYVRFRYGFK